MLDDSLRRILVDHIVRYPQMQVQDMYKLIYQAALGSEHALMNSVSAQNRLERELAALGSGPNDPLLDIISPDKRIVRVHLRPYLGIQGDPKVLLAAFIQTANEFKGSYDNLMLFGNVVIGWISNGILPFTQKAFSTLLAQMEAQGFPPAHHSDLYVQYYRPAYRVVARKYLKGL